jgi:hypothetical protein
MFGIVAKSRLAGLAPVKPPSGDIWLRRVYLGGLALSAVVGGAAIGAAYFAGSAPRLPKSLIVLESVSPAPGTWRALAGRRPTAPSVRARPPEKLALLPRSPDPAEAPPIGIADLPPLPSRVQ